MEKSRETGNPISQLLKNHQLFNFHDQPNPDCPVGRNIHQVLDNRLEEIQKAMNHKPFQPESEAYQKFILQTMLKIEQITKKIPSFDTQNELKALKSKLK